MLNTNRSIASELGQALSTLHSWYNSTDIEALQTLLCIHMLEDDDGYAQMADVRREVGIAPDKMTRCTRLLMGMNKSAPLSILGGNAARSPLIIMVNYENSPSVKRLGLTSAGRAIVSDIITPLHKRENRIKELKEQIHGQICLKQNIEALGFNPQVLSQSSGDNAIFRDRAALMLKAIINDMSRLTPNEMYDLGLPSVQKVMMEMPGFNPNENHSSSGHDAAERHKGFTFSCIRSMRTDE
jgi:hypothetical protein